MIKNLDILNSMVKMVCVTSANKKHMQLEIPGWEPCSGYEINFKMGYYFGELREYRKNPFDLEACNNLLWAAKIEWNRIKSPL